MVTAGPKRLKDPSALPFDTEATGSARFAEFCSAFIVTPKGTGAKEPMRLRPWQRELTGTLLDEDAQFVLWSLPRGQGKSTLVAALALFHAFCSGIEGARVVIVAQDERSAMRMLQTAARMIDLNEDLANRTKVFKDRIEVPSTASSILALPGEAHRIEGEDASLGIVDEIGFVRREAYESLLHSTGKREGSQLLMIGTPSPPTWRETSPMLDLVLDARANPHDEDFRLVEYGGDINHAPDCEHCWEKANPGIDDLVSRKHLRAALPPRSRESEYRRARLGEWVQHDDAAFLPPGVWASLDTGEPVPDGSQVVISLDGSFNGDATALLVATVSPTPHVDVLGLWESPRGDDTYRVPVLEVEQAIRDAAKRYKVVEVVADPFRWARSLQLLAAEGLPVVEFNQNASRMTPATVDTYQACLNGELTHSGNVDLTRHVMNAVVVEEPRGVRLAKEKKASRRRIDLAVCLVMAHSRATWRAMNKKRRRVASFA